MEVSRNTVVPNGVFLRRSKQVIEELAELSEAVNWLKSLASNSSRRIRTTKEMIAHNDRLMRRATEEVERMNKDIRGGKLSQNCHPHSRKDERTSALIQEQK